MKNRHLRLILRIAAALFILAGAAITVIQFTRYIQTRDSLPAGTTWGGIDVGGLNIHAAAEKVKAAYDQPLQLNYLGQPIQVQADQLGFNIDETFAASEQQINAGGFWNYLWNHPVAPVTIPIDPVVDEMMLKANLANEIAARYDNIPAEPMPIVGTTRFTFGRAGTQLDFDASSQLIKNQMISHDSRVVDLVVKDLPASQPDIKNLEIFLKQKIDQAGFTGIAEISLLDMKGRQGLHFAYRGGESLPVDIAFSAASTIKIPIMVSILKRSPEPIPADIDGLIKRMMILSENPPADQLMDQVLGSDLAPLTVSDDMAQLGLKNTFLAGYFYLGAPLLRAYETPANMRQDVTTLPDIYNQTTVGDMTTLLQAVYQCAKENRGLLLDTFPGEMTQSKCDYLLSIMEKNKIGVLFEAGVPEGTPVAHKHGWTEETDGYLHSLSDVGVIFGKESDFVLVVFLYDTNQLLFTPANELMAQLAQVVYNYFDLNNQIDWAFGPIDYR